MTSLYISELNKLQNSQKQIERYQLSIIEQLEKCEDSDAQQLLQVFQKSRVASEEAASKLEIREILEKLKYVRRAVLLECGNNIPDLKLFQKDLVNILSSIQDMKVHSQLKVEELQLEENRLNEDIKLYNERMCYWSESVKVAFQKNDVYAKVDSSNSVPKDVKKFTDFIKSSNGHENGWSVSDHHLFLKLRKKCKDVDDLALNLNEMLPDISLQEVKTHEAWYVKYLCLKEQYNKAIERWQKLKEDMKTTDISMVDQFESCNELEKNPFQYMRSVEKKTTERMKVKEDIDNWKKERELMERIQKSLKTEKSRQAKIKQEKNKQINRVKSEMVKEWKARKQALEEEQKNNEEAKNNIEHNVRVSVANKMVKLYQIQDKMSLEKKKFSQLENDKLVHRKKPKSCVQVGRDPKRLFRPTQQWIHRFLANNDNVAVKPLNFITKVPKLQVPFWRRNL